MSVFLRIEIARIMQAHVGREKAIVREELRDHLRLFQSDLDDRAFRKLYTSMAICSCVAGLFIPDYKNVSKGTQEVLDFKAYLSNGPGGPIVAYHRCGIIYECYPMLVPPAEQLHLPGMENEGATP